MATARACSSCGSNSLTSVRGVFEHGTTITTVSSNGGSVILAGDGDAIPALTRMTSSFATCSVLAQRLAPPEAPALRESIWSRIHDYFLLSSLLPVGIWFVAKWMGDGDGSEGGSTAWGWLAIVWLAAAIGAAFPVAGVRRRLRQEHEWNLKRWEKLVTRWEKLRYCPSCDSVVDPATNRATSASEMVKLLRAA